jgi:hypothetical protein
MPLFIPYAASRLQTVWRRIVSLRQQREALGLSDEAAGQVSLRRTQRTPGQRLCP